MFTKLLKMNYPDRYLRTTSRRLRKCRRCGETIMALTDRGSIKRNDAPAGPRGVKELFAAALLLALAGALALRAFVSPGALAPVVVTLLFAFAASVALGALAPRNRGRRAACLDIAGVLTFIGVGISLLLEPDQMVGLVTPSEQAD
jgi:peptidoglycan/LPS O-acetylase OafA/YrhL